MKRDTILIIDLGEQNNQRIAKMVRQLNVYCEIAPDNVTIEKIKSINPKGIIISDYSGLFKETPNLVQGIFDLNIPILGVGHGYLKIAEYLGSKIAKIDTLNDDITIETSSKLFGSIIGTAISCNLSINDAITSIPEGFRAICKAQDIIIGIEKDGIYGIAFHIADENTIEGIQILKNFIFNICNVTANWHIADFVEETIKNLQKDYMGKKVVCALSGGVDSSVCAVLVHKAIGKGLTCVFVDTGLMRKNEGDEVCKIYKEQFDMNLIRINAEERFLTKLKGITDPEQKRKIIGEEFIRVFEEVGKEIGSVDYLVQGTIYPDIIESGTKHAKVVKSHHNVGGLPDVIEFKGLIEPLRDLFKDEVRQTGAHLGIPSYLVNRQPFPGPGLAVRCIGEITKEKLDILREADYIFRDEMKLAGLETKVWQFFAILTDMKSVGVSSDERTYSYTVALRGVHSSDAMTATWAHIPYDVLEKSSKRITDTVKEVNRVVYDITGKPPATIEWE